ncbi:MAG: cellulase family glycosylhydrolase [Patescibacteria group bacterium]|nr:cellulase family glycosylhydrolase [Patescibacteria group bacterium]
MFRIIKRTKKILFILIIFLFLLIVLSQGRNYNKNELEYGLTFSKKQAESLGFDWRLVYLSILDDLGVKKLRLPAYWNEIETSDNEFRWEEMDWLVEETTKREAEIIIAVGGRLPRWPECHFPDWADDLPKKERDEKILEYIRKVVNRYKDNEKIIAWQVENEPFLSHFGDCPKLDKKFLDAEIALVRQLDDRPVIITDSGELSLWLGAARRADIFGTTLYRDTYSKFLDRYIHYPINPGFFHFKKNIVRLFARPKDWIVIELQAEPWGPVPYQEMVEEEKSKTMDLQKFREILEFGRLAGFREFYLWGGEWWYWEKEANNNPALWNEAKRLFSRQY